MCVDYTDLNRACPKDCYPLPRIDQLVDATAGHAHLSFMDAFSGYNQIRMAPKDQQHTAFLTDQGVYFYKVMPFWLKNAGATYQRTMNRMFAHQIGRNMKVYVDDMIVKSRTTTTHLSDLAETFDTIRRYNMRLNPAKCAFGVNSGKFLGFIIHERGIDVNPEKVRAIIDMQAPRTIKEVQRLNGRLAAMSRTPRTSHGRRSARRLFAHVKEHLASLPRLASVSPRERLGVYLAASRHVVSFVSIKEVSGEQLPVYYVSHVLNGPEERYPPIEKLVLALVLTARKLRPYFQAHPIEVITDQPLRQILSKFDLAGRLLKWSVELGEFDIQYVPRTAIKAQAVADFISKLTQPEDKDPKCVKVEWLLCVDGSSSRKGVGAGLVLEAPDGRSFERSLRFGFKATNNEAKYEALLAGLRLAVEMQVGDIRVLTDSQLVAEQLIDGYEARDPTMSKYLAEVKALATHFSRFTLSRVPRLQNERADMLAKQASRSGPGGKPDVEELPTHAITVAAVATAGPPTTWVQEMLQFKRHGTLPEDEVAAQCLRRTQAWYCEISGRLYRRSYSLPLLRCPEPEEAQLVLAEVHDGICGEHIGGRTLAFKALRQGVIITDNGTQFASARFKEFCATYGIQLRFSSVAHPQTNGLAEVTNRAILGGLRRRTLVARSAWVDELPSVLWSLRTTPKTATGESPYNLAFGNEAVLPAEVEITTPRTESYDEGTSADRLRAGLDLLEERRADAHLKALSYKRVIARIYNRRVRPRPIRLGDLVLRRAEVSNPTRAHGKLTPKWEGPYRVVEIVRPGTYRLVTLAGCSLPRTWNAQNIKKFFV
ncbi:uncharacterized protein LOC135650616 [Musa acuminata AAA Group]|uniref:uncharacterized protein LOC135650616 n=1 Tax=Musa acuminata AAA Group TaxID=214697 RepID=UPI0031DAB193